MSKVIVSYMGEVFRLSQKRWKKYLKDFAASKGPNLEEYGLSLGDCLNITDMTREWAKQLLEELK